MDVRKRWWFGVLAIAIAVMAAFGGATLRAQQEKIVVADGAKAKAVTTDKAKEAAKAEATAARATLLAEFRKQFAACPTSLATAIAAAETSSKGKAHHADVGFNKQHQLQIVVGMVVGEKFVEVAVDPKSGKVLAAAEDDEDEADEDEDEGDEDGDAEDADEDEDD